MRAVLFIPATRRTAASSAHAKLDRAGGDRARQRRPAYAYFRSFLPAAQNDRAEIREIEPYVHARARMRRPRKNTRRSRVPWLSGTASWAHYTAAQHILGVRPEIDGFASIPAFRRVAGIHGASGDSAAGAWRSRCGIEWGSLSVRCLMVDGIALPGISSRWQSWPRDQRSRCAWLSARAVRPTEGHRMKGQFLAWRSAVI